MRTPARLIVISIIGLGMVTLPFAKSYCSDANPAATADESLLKAPFLWGVANASFQVEGSPQPSDWLSWTQRKLAIKDGTNADVATDFWNKYDADFELTQKLGANAFRMSIAWERIEPSPGHWDEGALQHYEDIIVAMRARGIEPVVTLEHFVLPLWLSEKGGLQSDTFEDEFVKYAVHVIPRLSQGPAHVVYWLTLNEPVVMAMAGYLDGDWPPGVRGSFPQTFQGMARLARAHIKTVLKLHEDKSLNIKISFADHWRDFQPASDAFADRVALKVCAWLFNDYFINAVMTGKMHVLPDIVIPKGERTLDFLGFNYYGRTIVKAKSAVPFFETYAGPGPKTEVGWEVYPEGLYHILKETQKYGLPIMITENGVAERGAEDTDGNITDPMREEFLKTHIAEMMKAKAEGVPVIGYLHWSLTDNFEWAKGETPRFGLVAIDYKTLERKPRASFSTYKTLIEHYR